MKKPTPSAKIFRGTQIMIFLGSLAVGLGFFCILMYESTSASARDQSELAQMTAAFTTAYTRERNAENSVPATFRRQGIEEFTRNAISQDSQSRPLTTIRMPGTPGGELETIESDWRIRAFIRDLVIAENPEPIVENRLENGRFIGRSIIPSIASSMACVNCHNQALGRDVYERGDIMGAFVVETDLTSSARTNAIYALVIFALSLFFGGVMAQRENHRIQRIVTTLKGQVDAERKRREAEAFANFLSSHDTLTGLSNRSIFMSYLDQCVADVVNDDADEFYVGLIDLDDFKSVNDNRGHDAGDALLKHVGQKLRELTEQIGGIAARLGGDEFAVLIQRDSDIDSAEYVGKLLLKALDQDVKHNGFNIEIKCSVGLAAVNDVFEPTAAAMLKAADTALYAAKGDGKGRFRIFDDELGAIMGRRSELMAALPKALKSGGLDVAYQTKIDLRTGQPYGFEALARWTHGGEAVPPSEFVQIAEDQNLIRDLDIAVLIKAGRFATDLERRANRPVRISTNLSVLNFRMPGLADDILDAVWHAGLKPERLTVEITETALMEKWDAVREFTSKLRHHKIQVALDDFGTGYSSLSYLRHIQFEEIKIDRNFVRDLVGDRGAQNLFNGIVDLATRLGKRIVVEGIETDEQLVLAKRMNAHIGQGYLFSHPMSGEEACAIFLANPERRAIGK